MCQDEWEERPHHHPYVCTAPLEADVVADLAGGASAGLRQEQPTVGANANLVDGLAGPRG